MDRITLPLHRVLIDRGRSQIRVDVPEHELRVLRAVHAGSAVKLVERDVDEGEFDPSASAEIDRLTRTYHRVGAPDPVRAVFLNGPDDLRPFGFSPEAAPLSRPDDLRVFDARREVREAKKRAKTEARPAA